MYDDGYKFGLLMMRMSGQNISNDGPVQVFFAMLSIVLCSYNMTLSILYIIYDNDVRNVGRIMEAIGAYSLVNINGKNRKNILNFFSLVYSNVNSHKI